MTVPQVLDNKTWRSQTAATTLQMKRSRARKSADARILAEMPGLYD